jgi:hypothetical protein
MSGERPGCDYCFGALDPQDERVELRAFVKCSRDRQACSSHYHSVCWEGCGQCQRCGGDRVQPADVPQPPPVQPVFKTRAIAVRPSSIVHHPWNPLLLIGVLMLVAFVAVGVTMGMRYLAAQKEAEDQKKPVVVASADPVSKGGSESRVKAVEDRPAPLPASRPPPPAVARPASPAPQSSGDTVQGPSFSVGDEFIMEHKNLTIPKLSYTAERKVISLDGRQMKVTARNINPDSNIKNLFYDRQWNLVAMRGDGGEGCDYSPPIKYYDFPLHPGKQWSGTSTERDIKTGRVREHSIYAQVGEWETITVPAGTFRTLKVTIRHEVKDLQTGQVTSGTDISWYAPAAKRSVKSELTTYKTRDGRDDVQIVQLVRYSLR